MRSSLWTKQHFLVLITILLTSRTLSQRRQDFIYSGGWYQSGGDSWYNRHVLNKSGLSGYYSPIAAAAAAQGEIVSNTVRDDPSEEYEEYPDYNRLGLRPDQEFQFQFRIFWLESKYLATGPFSTYILL